MSGYFRSLCASLVLLVSAPAPATDVDPPGRVGRISLAAEGTLLRIGDSTAAGESALNWPLTSGAVIETSGGARAEARIGSTVIRLDGGTSLEFVKLNDERIWLRLKHGSIALKLSNPDHAAAMALDASDRRLSFDAPGSYRADALSGTTAITTILGSARIEDSGLAIRNGERIMFVGGAGGNYIVGVATNDAFRQWCLWREQSDSRRDNRHVSPEMTGHEALEGHGTWHETAEQGPAWFPQGLPVDWAPYRWGRWAWVAPWGWTWIDNAPWGFAPFHYGRWALIADRWAWLPGTYVARPVYAPALVAWLGRPGWSATFSFGTSPAVGWYPLGPREVYYPHFRCSVLHVRNINVTHVTHVTQITTVAPQSGYDRHIHRHRHQAVTVVPEQAVVSGHPINHSIVVHDKAAIMSAPLTHLPPIDRPHHNRDEGATTAAAAVKPGYLPPPPPRQVDVARHKGDPMPHRVLAPAGWQRPPDVPGSQLPHPPPARTVYVKERMPSSQGHMEHGPVPSRQPLPAPVRHRQSVIETEKAPVLRAEHGPRGGSFETARETRRREQSGLQRRQDR